MLNQPRPPLPSPRWRQPACVAGPLEGVSDSTGRTPTGRAALCRAEPAPRKLRAAGAIDRSCPCVLGKKARSAGSHTPQLAK